MGNTMFGSWRLTDSLGPQWRQEFGRKASTALKYHVCACDLAVQLVR